MKFMQNVGDGEVGLENGAVGETSEDWVKDFNTSKNYRGERIQSMVNTEQKNKINLFFALIEVE